MYPKRNTDRTTVIAPIIRMSIAARMLHGKPWRWRRSMYPVNHAITASDGPRGLWCSIQQNHTRGSRGGFAQSVVIGITDATRRQPDANVATAMAEGERRMRAAVVSLSVAGGRPRPRDRTILPAWSGSRSIGRASRPPLPTGSPAC
jgi:hypothetical protein